MAIQISVADARCVDSTAAHDRPSRPTPDGLTRTGSRPAARLSDGETLVRLLTQLHPAYPPQPELVADVLIAALRAQGRTLLVATIDGVVVGTADLLVVQNLTHGCRPWAIVENVVVDDGKRPRRRPGAVQGDSRHHRRGGLLHGAAAVAEPPTRRACVLRPPRVRPRRTGLPSLPGGVRTDTARGMILPERSVGTRPCQGRHGH